VTFDAGDETVLNRYVFDVSKGCVMVRSLLRDAGGEERYEGEYAAAAGVWLPTAATYRTVRGPADGPRQTDAIDVRFARVVVNGPVDPAELTPAAMGVRPGDTIQDVANRRAYPYEPPAAADKPAR
jgi:hypothetical protein